MGWLQEEVCEGWRKSVLAEGTFSTAALVTPGWILHWGAVSCIVGYLAASLALYPPNANSTSPHSQLWQRKVSLDTAKCPLEAQITPALRNTLVDNRTQSTGHAEAKIFFKWTRGNLLLLETVIILGMDLNSTPFERSHLELWLTLFFSHARNWEIRPFSYHYFQNASDSSPICSHPWADHFLGLCSLGGKC